MSNFIDTTVDKKNNKDNKDIGRYKAILSLLSLYVRGYLR
jgi:hypothetical protein